MMLGLALMAGTTAAVAQDIIPMPQHVEMHSGKLNIAKPLNIVTNLTGSDKDDLVGFISDSPLKVTCTGKSSSRNYLRLTIDPQSPHGDEGYTLDVTTRGAEITAKTTAGLFYGFQSLLQLAEEGDFKSIAAISIEDAPRFDYRGMHLDESRHFSDKEFVKKQLDAMARYKMNRFHWHLTDGAGWRIEIKKYPRLTNFAAWRPYDTWKEWWQGDRLYCTQDDPKAYGGYYTQDDVREIVEYARRRHITIIPEIEMPGHSEEVLAAYPLLSCANDMYKNSDLCIGKEATFAFLEDVLTEMIDLFPSHYIHIGGDEAVKSGWASCPDCQKRMKEEGLDNVDELQSYMIHRIEQFVNSKGRDIIGWDEILQGGLAPNATVMSWRGEEGGIKAAKAKHDVVMVPGSHCYLDSYQADPSTQPEAIGGYLTLEKVYSYDPIPEVLDESEKQYILGVQGNLWREYIPTEEQVEYMIYPRIIAIAEVGWTEPEHKDWQDFRQRVSREIPRLQAKGYNPFTLSTDIETPMRVDYANQNIRLALTCERPGMDIHYTLDGTEPTAQSPVYRDSLTLRGTTQLAARAFAGGKPEGRTLHTRIDYHKAIGKKVTLAEPHSVNYPASGAKTLVDGYRGGKGYGDGRWLGFLNNNLDATIDLGEMTDISYVQLKSMQAKGPYVWLPQYVQLQVSDDGRQWTDLARLTHDIPVEREDVLFHEFVWQGQARARYIRCYAPIVDIDGAWIFVDEIVVQ